MRNKAFSAQNIWLCRREIAAHRSIGTRWSDCVPVESGTRPDVTGSQQLGLDGRHRSAEPSSCFVILVLVLFWRCRYDAQDGGQLEPTGFNGGERVPVLARYCYEERAALNRRCHSQRRRLDQQGGPHENDFAVLVISALMAGCVSDSDSQARPPNYVASQANQSPALRNDNFGGAAMARRELPH
jgi:hypothetical protein